MLAISGNFCHFLSEIDNKIENFKISGSLMTSEMIRQLTQASHKGQIRTNECCQVSNEQWQDNLWQVLSRRKQTSI